MQSYPKEKYAWLPDPNSIPNSRSQSPNIPSSLPTDDLHYAYSTSLRRHEPDTPINQQFAPLPTASANPYAPNHQHQLSPPVHRQGYSHHPFAHTTSPLTPSAHYATLSVPQTISALSTSATAGLLSSKIPAIRELSGPNEFEVPAKDPLWKRFAGQFYESPLILLLLGSAGVSAVVGNYDDAASILAAIVIVVTVGFIQEQRSEKSLEALNKLVPHYCHLIRLVFRTPRT